MTSFAELEALWIGAGGPRSMASLMAHIAEAESSGQAGVINSIGACGLWQIHPFQPGCTNPQANARMAVEKWRTQGLGAWAASRSVWGKFLGQAGNVPPSAVGGAGGGGAGGSAGNATLTAAAGGGLLGSIDPFRFFLDDLATSVGAANPKDLFVRLGLILVGGLLILVGVFMLAGRTASTLALTVVAPETKATKVLDKVP